MSKHLYLVGVDGSEWGERAAMRAVNLAKQSGAHVKLVCVIEWSPYQSMSIEEFAQRPIDKKEEERKAQDEVLGPLLDKFKDNDVSVESDYLWGNPAEVLHNIAKNEHAHFVFVGRRGRSRFIDLLIGSVANKLAHLTGVPIVLVP